MNQISFVFTAEPKKLLTSFMTLPCIPYSSVSVHSLVQNKKHEVYSDCFKIVPDVSRVDSNLMETLVCWLNPGLGFRELW